MGFYIFKRSKLEEKFYSNSYQRIRFVACGNANGLGVGILTEVKPGSEKLDKFYTDGSFRIINCFRAMKILDEFEEVEDESLVAAFYSGLKYPPEEFEESVFDIEVSIGFRKREQILKKVPEDLEYLIDYLARKNIEIDASEFEEETIKGNLIPGPKAKMHIHHYRNVVEEIREKEEQEKYGLVVRPEDITKLILNEQYMGYPTDIFLDIFNKFSDRNSMIGILHRDEGLEHSILIAQSDIEDYELTLKTGHDYTNDRRFLSIEIDKGQKKVKFMPKKKHLFELPYEGRDDSVRSKFPLFLRKAGSQILLIGTGFSKYKTILRTNDEETSEFTNLLKEHIDEEIKRKQKEITSFSNIVLYPYSSLDGNIYPV